MANLALDSSGMIEPVEFYGKLATHVTNCGRLVTLLDAPGIHKGPPLYSGGALVAFTSNACIRERSRGERGLGDVLRGESLPLADAFSRLGLVMSQEGDGAVRIEMDPTASEGAQALRRAVMGGNR